jgi:hypothetical protein
MIGDIYWNSRRTEQMIHAPKYNEWVRQSWQPFWVSNAMRTYGTIEDIFIKKNADINVLPQKNEPVLILGSGPSLDDWRPYIKEWKHDIMCSTSQLAWLQSLKINPRYIFLIDADPTMNYLLHNYKPEEDQPCPELITHPCIQREAIHAWGRPDNTYFFRMLDPGDPFFTQMLPMAYQTLPIPPKEDQRGVRTYIMNSGNVMNTMLVFANQKKYSPIFLCGYDLGFPGNQYRFTNYEEKGGKWEPIVCPPVPADRQFRQSHNGVLTDELCLFYKYSTIIMYGMAVPNLLSCSRGIVDEIPYVPPAEVIKTQGKGFPVRTAWESYKVAQEYLRYRKIFILKTGFAVSVQNMTEMKFWPKVQTLLRWYYWKDRQDWDAQAVWHAKKMQKKQARMAKKKPKKTPYDIAPKHLAPTATMPYQEKVTNV